MERYYGLQVGMRVEQRAFGRSIIGIVIRLDPRDNNRVYLRLDDGTEYPAVAEWCYERAQVNCRSIRRR